MLHVYLYQKLHYWTMQVTQCRLTISPKRQWGPFQTTSICSIWLQRHLTLVGQPASIALSLPLGRPSSVPITIQSAAYRGVMC